MSAALGCGEPPVDLGAHGDAIQTQRAYTFVSEHAGLCLDVGGRDLENGATLELRACDGSAGQQFVAEPASAGHVLLRNRRSGRCIDVWERSRAAGAAIAQFDCHGRTNQQLAVQPVGSGGRARIVSRLSGMALDAEAFGTRAGTRIIQWPITGGANQTFVVMQVPSERDAGVSLPSDAGVGVDPCAVPPPPSALVGWASVPGHGVSTTTGGGDAAPVVVTRLSELQEAVRGTTPRVIHVRGVLAPGRIEVGSNKTLVGLCGAEIHGTLRLSRSSNVIVRNLAIVGFGEGSCALDPDFDPDEGCSSGNDAVAISNESHHVWFDHCEVRDGTDGSFDITNGSDLVTVSWTRFTYRPRTDDEGSDSTGAAGHRFSSLVGGTDTPSEHDDRNALNVTWHHNHWGEGVVERMPRIRFGRNHLFDNLFDSSVASYCVRAGRGARVLLENNVFDGVRDPHEFNNATDRATAHIAASGNEYVGGTSGERATGGGAAAWTRPEYRYSLEPASTVRASVLAEVGPRR